MAATAKGTFQQFFSVVSSKVFNCHVCFFVFVQKKAYLCMKIHFHINAICRSDFFGPSNMIKLLSIFAAKALWGLFRIIFLQSRQVLVYYVHSALKNSFFLVQKTSTSIICYTIMILYYPAYSQEFKLAMFRLEAPLNKVQSQRNWMWWLHRFLCFFKTMHHI